MVENKELKADSFYIVSVRKAYKHWLRQTFTVWKDAKSQFQLTETALRLTIIC